MMAVAVGQSLRKANQKSTSTNIAMGGLAIALPALPQRLWWHTKAYSVSAGILLLLGASLIVLRLHSFYQGSLKRARLTDSPASVNAHHD